MADDKMKIPCRYAIEFTNHCNFKCTLCPHNGRLTRDRGCMPENVFEAVLRNVRAYARYVSVAFIGEPTLHSEFVDYIIRLAQDKTFRITLFSNWSVVTDQIMDAARFCDIVRISLDASNAELFGKLCPGGDYETIVGNIERWLGSKHPETHIVFVTSSLNLDDKSAFLAKWLPKLSAADKIITKPVISYGGLMSNPYMYENKCKVRRKRRFAIAWNGDVTPCNLDVNTTMRVGNILRSDIPEIVASKAYKQRMQYIKKKTGACKNCFDANNHQETVFHHA